VSSRSPGKQRVVAAEAEADQGGNVEQHVAGDVVLQALAVEVWNVTSRSR
jgi:hypothetical protein